MESKVFADFAAAVSDIPIGASILVAGFGVAQPLNLLRALYQQGAYEASANGDFANWKLPGRKGGGIGGAIDIASCAKRIFVMMEHTTREGEPRLLKRCTLPITAPGVVTLVVIDLGVFEPLGNAFHLKGIAPGHTPQEVQKVTGAPLVYDRPVKEARV